MTARELLILLACCLGAWGLSELWAQAEKPQTCSRGHRDFYRFECSWRCRQCERAASRRRLKRRRQGRV